MANREKPKIGERINPRNFPDIFGPSCLVDYNATIGFRPCEVCGWDKATCDQHHIIPRSQGGNNQKENLIDACPNCHRMIHAGLLSLNKTTGKWEEKYG